MRGDTHERVRSCCGRPGLFGLQRCRKIWPEDSANSPPATRHMPPSLETDTERFGIQEHLFQTVCGEHLVYRCQIRTKASVALTQITFVLIQRSFEDQESVTWNQIKDKTFCLFENDFKVESSHSNSHSPGNQHSMSGSPLQGPAACMHMRY